jgi:hypothetical protein
VHEAMIYKPASSRGALCPTTCSESCFTRSDRWHKDIAVVVVLVFCLAYTGCNTIGSRISPSVPTILGVCGPPGTCYLGSLGELLRLTFLPDTRLGTQMLRLYIFCAGQFAGCGTRGAINTCKARGGSLTPPMSLDRSPQSSMSRCGV